MEARTSTRTRTRRVVKRLAAVGVLALVAGACQLVTVDESSVNSGGTPTPGEWFVVNQAGAGTVGFGTGPATPPLGAGSLQLTTGASADKVGLYNYDWGYDGFAAETLRLADLDALSFDTYSSSDDPSSVLAPIFQMEIDPDGPAVSGVDDYSTLNFEPYIMNSLGSVPQDTWTRWVLTDSTRVWGTGLAGADQSHPVTWSDFLALYPDAEVRYGIGFNVGSGWTETFSGAADRLILDVAGEITIYNFETTAP